MKRLSWAFLFVCCLVADSKAQVYNLIGTSGDEFTQSGTPLLNGDHLIFGHSKNTAGQQDAWLVRTNRYGEQTYAYKFGGSGVETGFGCVATKDGGYAVTGGTTSAGAGGKDIYVIRFGADNNILWQYTFGGGADEESHEIINTSDSGFLVAGYTRSFGHSSYNSYILKLSSSGNLQWSKVLYTATADLAYRCLESQGYYYISNTVNISSSFGMGDVHLTKLDKDGNFIWNRAYGGSRNENSWKLIETMDKNLAMVFANSSFSGGAYKELAFLKIDTSGKNIFCVRFTNNGKATDGFDLVQLRDSSFAIAGHTLEVGPAGWRGMVVHISKNGTLNKAWYASFADEGNLWQIKQTGKSGEFAFYGYGKHSAKGNYDFIFGIADSTFTLSCKDWKVITGAATVPATTGEKAANNMFTFTNGGIVGDPGWSLTSDSLVNVTELNYQPLYGTTLPAVFYRCLLDSIKLDAGAQQRYSWNTGATSRVIFAKEFKTYHLKFLRNYCIGYDSVRIQKISPEKLELSDDTCGNGSIDIAVPFVSGRVYTWNNGSNTPQTTFIASGKYKVTVTDTSRKCISTDSINISLPGITAALYSDSSDHCRNTNFQALRTTLLLETQNDVVKSFDWYDNFGKVQSGGQYLLYRAMDTGSFLLKLAIRSAKGCFDSLEYPYTVYPNPKSIFTASDTLLCFQKSRPVFVNISRENGRNYQHRWNWGDGTETPDTDSLVHTFPGSGKFVVSLNCMNDKGCADISSQQIELLATPKLKLVFQGSAVQCIKGNYFEFVDQSTCDDARRSLSRSWNSGDGETLKDSSIFRKKFQEPGTYAVWLKVSTDEGCTDSAMEQVEVYPSPDIHALQVSSKRICLNENPVHFKVDPDTITGPRIFHTGDGTDYIRTNSISHSYKKPGIFHAVFIAGNSLGCLDSASVDVEILPAPTATIGVNNSAQCLANNQFVFTALNVNPGETFLWNFSDGTNASGLQAMRSFNSAGTYSTTLIVSDQNGCRDSGTAQQILHPQPIADFTVDPVCEGIASRFEDKSSITSGTINKYRWYFNGVAHDTLPTAAFKFGNAGTYGASLVVTSSFGCIDSVFKNTALVRASPQASFEWEIESESMEEDIWLAKSTTVNAIAYEWKTDAGNFGFNNTFRHRVSDSHGIWLTLMVTDPNGCTDTTIQWRSFPFYSNVFIPNAFTPNSDPHNSLFRPHINKKLKNYHLWILDRWGAVLFQTNDPMIGWDGTYGAKPVPDGVYVYKIAIGEKYNFGGTVQVVR